MPVESLEVTCYRVPTDFPESDGTLEWRATTLVVVEALGGGRRGLGFTYADAATGAVIRDLLSGVVAGRSAMDIEGCYESMSRAVRNLGRGGVCAMAISAVDIALWDLKARLLELPLARLLGTVRDAAPAYGSGGFTSYPVRRLERQLSDWIAAGLTMVKMKVGREPECDPARVRAARKAIGAEAGLFVDANGAYSRSQALDLAGQFGQLGVTWLEEPVVASDLEGLRWIRDRVPAGMDVAAGEYGYDLPDFTRMLEAGSVHVLQADATRCGGVTGFLRVASLCQARFVPLSSHCAPSLHVALGCAAAPFRHLEYFHDHVRIEHMLFEGAERPKDGRLRPGLSRPGLGLTLRRRDAERYQL